MVNDADLQVAEGDDMEEEEFKGFSDREASEVAEEDDDGEESDVDVGTADLLEEKPFDGVYIHALTLPSSLQDALLPEWAGIDVHTSLKRSLLALGFVNPTKIQSRSVGPGTSGRDIVGVAETGSGKTLAYSLPVLSYLLRTSAPGKSSRRPLSALVLCPTRELALQVVDHLQKVVKHALKDDRPGPPRISVGSVVGGLSAQKQKRIVERGCDILVATPGRLWDLIKTVCRLIRGLLRC